MMQRRAFTRLVAGTAAAAVMLGTERSARACLWDSDTFAQEARGIPNAVVTLLGGFARNPPKYYELRLARVEAALADTPDELALYDDAAVACDRLGRQDQAVALMARKRQALERLGISRTDAQRASPNHWYRYHANLGTFHAHRWFHDGADLDTPEQLQLGHDLIAKAIEDNPEAHFGREKYQLRALAWLLGRPSFSPDQKQTGRFGDSLPTFIELEPGHFHTMGDNDYLATHGLGDAVEGLCGLITLGAAWDSFDVTAALAYVLAVDGKQSVAQFASLRCKEIWQAGGRTLVVGAPAGYELLELLPQDLGFFSAERYTALRARADAWVQERERYMLERLDRGEHPDTHGEFWTAFAGNPSHTSVAALGLDLEAEAEARTRELSKAARSGHGCGCTTETSEGPWTLALATALLAGARARARAR